MGAVIEELRTALNDAAPSLKTAARSHVLFALDLGHAELDISEPRADDAQDGQPLPFTVIAFADISVHVPPGRGVGAYLGRSHSLSYCDLEAEDRFAWYELAFVADIPAPYSTAPWALSPREAASAILPGFSHTQVARTPTKVVPGDLDEFIDRWGRWLSEAYLGPWERPAVLPERRVSRNWRGT